MKESIKKKLERLWFIPLVVLILGLIITDIINPPEYVPVEKVLVSREVVTVYPYVSRETNQFGDITDEDIVYYIVWKSSTGELRIWDEYDPSSYYYDLKFGEENRIVFNPNDKYDGNTCLYLTEETLKECINNKLN